MVLREQRSDGEAYVACACNGNFEAIDIIHIWIVG